jgi:hypothetical protein
MRQAGQNRKERTAEQDSYEEQDNQKEMVRMGQAEQNRQNKTARTKLPGQDC